MKHFQLFFLSFPSKEWLYIALIGFAILLFFYWLIDKKFNSRTYILSFALIFLVLFSPVIFRVSAPIFIGIFLSENHQDREFNKESWDADISNRHEMRSDLLNSNILIGKTKAEVIDMLGQPMTRIKSKDSLTETWRFNLGTESHGFGWKFNVLVLKFEYEEVIKIKTEEFID